MRGAEAACLDLGVFRRATVVMCGLLGRASGADPPPAAPRARRRPEAGMADPYFFFWKAE
ncbi:hypothetical protein GCM10010402_34310 [Actinomadura luteofluorescens]